MTAPVTNHPEDGQTRLKLKATIDEGVAAALDGLDTHLVHEPAYADGMATSLCRGVSTLGSSVDAVLVALGDQPRSHPAPGVTAPR